MKASCKNCNWAFSPDCIEWDAELCENYEPAQPLEEDPERITRSLEEIADKMEHLATCALCEYMDECYGKDCTEIWKAWLTGKID